jgi:hypothetical protein
MHIRAHDGFLQLQLSSGLMKVDRQIFIKQKLFQFRPHVMKKILLGVTGVRAEMRGGKAAQAWLAGAAAREIKQLQRAFNPDIHGKRGIKSVGEEQNAVGNLPAHAAQFHQFRAGFTNSTCTGAVRC